MPNNLATLSTEELISAYGDLIQLLKQRGVIHTKNVVGDIGEHLAVNYYNSRTDLAKLERSQTNTTDVDATVGNDRYSIKSTTVNRTGAFHLPDTLTTEHTDAPAFEYVVVVMLTDTYRLQRIQQFTWREFLSVKTWSKRQKAWFIPLTRDVLTRGKQIYPPVET